MKNLSFTVLPALAALALASQASAQTRTTTQPTPARPAQAQPQQQGIQVNSVPLVCRVREQQIVGLNGQINQALQAAQRETDATRRQQAMQQRQQLQASLRESEASWSRMNCAGILYNARQ